MTDNFEYEQSSTFVLKDGRYFLEERQSQIFSTIIKERPHFSSEYRWDELSLGELFAKCYKPFCRYCPEVKEWFAYKTTRWVRDVGSVIVSGYMKEFTKLLNLYCNEIPDDTDDEGKSIAEGYKKFVTKMGDRRVRDRVLRDAQDEAAISIEKFDSNPYLINCQNGTYDLEEGALRPHNPNDFITMITNCYYPQPSQRLEFPRWAEFINEITCGQKDVAKYLQRALGYSLYGVAKEECMFIAYGKTTRNGKGTLFNTIHAILGDYSGTMPVDFICVSKGRGSYDRANPMLAGLRGKRFLTLSESDDAGKLNEAEIKNYTGNDPITTRNLHEKAFTYTPQFKMWLSCNTLPTVTDRSLFSSDRVRVIEFNRHFDENERDTTLKSKFLEEDAKAIIFKWLIDGYINYHLHGLNPPKSVVSATGDYEKKNDWVALFIEERCDTSKENARIGRGELYTAYKSWCTSNGIRYTSCPRFNDAVERFAKTTTYSGIKQWKGITLKALGGVKIKGVDKKEDS